LAAQAATENSRELPAHASVPPLIAAANSPHPSAAIAPVSSRRQQDLKMAFAGAAAAAALIALGWGLALRSHPAPRAISVSAASRSSQAVMVPPVLTTAAVAKPPAVALPVIAKPDGRRAL